jgi:hypothetical protein
MKGEKMKKNRFRKTLALLIAAVCFMVPAASVKAASESAPMYRFYNPNSGEHFYTGSLREGANIVNAGWRAEGVGWYQPSSGANVYRLYNPNAGDHHYTVNPAERNRLISLGWRYEGVGWKSATSGSRVPIYRQYNPNARSGAHNFTASRSENDSLARIGWRAEGIAFYGVSGGTLNFTSGSGLKTAAGNYSATIDYRKSMNDETNNRLGRAFAIFPEENYLIVHGGMAYDRNTDFENFDYPSGNNNLYIFRMNTNTRFGYSGGDGPTEYTTRKNFFRTCRDYSGLGLLIEVGSDGLAREVRIAS